MSVFLVLFFKSRVYASRRYKKFLMLYSMIGQKYCCTWKSF